MLKNIATRVSQNKRNLFLSFFRGISFIIAAIQIITADIQFQLYAGYILLFALVGVYTIFKIFIPFRWYRRDTLTYFVLVSDLIVCSSLAFVTGGLSSAFVLYALNPILTVALVLSLPFALLTATVIATSVTASELLGINYNFLATPGLGVATEYLGTLIIFIVICFLSSTLPYMVNDRLRDRIGVRSIIEERHRLAQEMHDNLAQSIGYLKLKTRELLDLVSFGAYERATVEIREAKTVIDGIYTDIRQTLGILWLDNLDDKTLLASIANYVSEFGTQTGIRTIFISGINEPGLADTAKLHILRLIQESLRNVRNHSKARSVEVRLENQNRGIVLSIKDDGIGFSLPEYLERYDKNTHIGMKVMEERAAAIGGTMDVVTSPGKGTSISFFIPSTKDVVGNGTQSRIATSR